LPKKNNLKNSTNSDESAFFTLLSLEDQLPLTCTRAGTCCHGKEIWINPWEIHCLAEARKLSARDFRDQHTVNGGMRLRFDGPAGWNNLPACSQYDATMGCLAHKGRPLACRLFPLGRRIHLNQISYFHEGNLFPCISGCPEVNDLPLVSVGDYLSSQKTTNSESAHDAYLELAQILADDALHLFLDSGLATCQKREETLDGWRDWGAMSDQFRAEAMGESWYDELTIPRFNTSLADPIALVQDHGVQLETKIELEGATIKSLADLDHLCCLVMGLSLHLSTGLGLSSTQMAKHWIETAQCNLLPQ